ncbi:MAG: RNA polymerase sigma factor [Sphingobacteriaceae bacterium]|nr:RNA polymerase sigma factor [Sphingobacteriaceae bacterium]
MKSYKEIIDKVITKDPTGLRDLYEAYGKSFYAYSIKRWQLTEDDAWDIVYKTLETLILKLSNYEFESQAKFEGFLYTVLVNFIRQHFRSRRVKDQQEMKYVDLDTQDGISTDINQKLNEASFNEYYSAEVIESSSLLLLKDALNKLEVVDRDILLLRAQNYSYEEIASFLKIDNNQLKVKHHRAKKKLVDMLKISESNTTSNE